MENEGKDPERVSAKTNDARQAGNGRRDEKKKVLRMLGSAQLRREVDTGGNGNANQSKAPLIKRDHLPPI